jgi:uncharacterized protein (TIGR02118 family)
MVNRIVDVQRWDYAKVVGAPDGGEVPYYLIAELYFTDPTALQAALTSAEGKAVAADYQSFAPPGSRMFVAELTTE